MQGKTLNSLRLSLEPLFFLYWFEAYQASRTFMSLGVSMTRTCQNHRRSFGTTMNSTNVNQVAPWSYLFALLNSKCFQQKAHEFICLPSNLTLRPHPNPKT